MMACYNDDAETARVLLDHGAVVDYQNEVGNANSRVIFNPSSAHNYMQREVITLVGLYT